MNTHEFQPIIDRETGRTVAQCTRCGHRWYGKGEAKTECVEPTKPVFWLQYQAAGDANVLTSRDQTIRVPLEALAFEQARHEATEKWQDAEPARNWLCSPCVVCDLDEPKPTAFALPQRSDLRRVVETDNFGRDYPDERFVGPALSAKTAQAVADLLNRDLGPNHPRYFKVVTLDYKLSPGFEP